MNTDLNKPLRDSIQRDIQALEKLSRFCDLLNEELPSFYYTIVSAEPSIRFYSGYKSELVEQFGEDGWFFNGETISKEVHGVRLEVEYATATLVRQLTPEEMLK